MGKVRRGLRRLVITLEIVLLETSQSQMGWNMKKDKGLESLGIMSTNVDFMLPHIWKLFLT